MKSVKKRWLSLLLVSVVAGGTALTSHGTRVALAADPSRVASVKSEPVHILPAIVVAVVAGGLLAALGAAVTEATDLGKREGAADARERARDKDVVTDKLRHGRGGVTLALGNVGGGDTSILD